MSSRTEQNSDDLAFASIAELAPRLRDGCLSPVALTEAVLARCDRHGEALNCYITRMDDAARAAAKASEARQRAGKLLSPLDGIPLAIKDCLYTAGTLTSFGSPLFADFVPDEDATVVATLKAAGAVHIGKTNLHEITTGTTSSNPYHGPVRNPWDTSRHPGGSSGGTAAAVAAGLAIGGLGTDTGGSIRQPAAVTGIVGLKPTYGRVSKYGCLPVSWSMDHVGPMTRSVADAAIMLQVLAGADPRDPTTADRTVPDFSAEIGRTLEGARIGVLDSYFDDCEDEVAQQVTAAIARMEAAGAKVADVAWPDRHLVHAAGVIILSSELATYHAKRFVEERASYSDDVSPMIETGGWVTARQHLQAQRLRAVLGAQVAGLFADFDAFVLPSTPVTATPIGTEPDGHPVLRGRNTIPFNLLGLPAISLPCGWTTGGLPVGLQMVGAAFEEAELIGLAAAFEALEGPNRRRPEIQ